MFGLFLFYGIYYTQKEQMILSDMRVYRVFLDFGLSFVFVLIFAITYKIFSKRFLIKSTKILFCTGYFFFHGLYIKNNISFYLLGNLLSNFEKELALNIFKIVLLIYYIFYQQAAKYFMLVLYKDILKENADLPINMVITTTKYISIDVLSIKVMNVLTIPLTQIYSWISFVEYLYFLISAYFYLELGRKLFVKLFSNIFKIKSIKVKSSQAKHYDKLISGCILEANIIIAIRILIYAYYNYFFYVTKVFGLYENCTLKQSHYIKFNFFTENVIMIFSVHLALVIGILFFMVKKKRIILNVVVENFSFLIRTLFFIMYYTQIDVCIQYYIILQNYQ